MARSFRLRALLHVASLSTAISGLAVGCAESADPDFDGLTTLDASADTGRSDASVTLPSPSPDVPTDAGADVKQEGGTKDAGDDGDDVDNPKDAGSDAGNAGTDSGVDAGDGTATKPLQGEIVISEVMYNPSGAEPATEWIELHNTASGPRLLSGLVLKDGASPTHSHTIKPGLVIAPGAYIVLASTTTAQVPAVVYHYNAGVAVGDQVVLGNSDNGSIVLLDGTTEIARAKYGALNLDSATNGQSIQLKTLTYAAAGVASNWCKSSNPWAAGTDKGTPGAPSDCP